MIKKIAPVIIITVILIPGTFLLIKYEAYMRDTSSDKTFFSPRIEAAVFELTGSTQQKTEMVVNLEIDNPLPFKLTADSLSCKISMNGRQIIHCIYRHPVSLKRSDSSWISIPLSVLTEDINAISARADEQKKDSISYELHATFYTHILFKKKFTLAQIKFLPVIYIPSLKVDTIDVDSLKRSGARLTLRTIFINRNVFPLNYTDLTYTVLIQNHQWASGVENHIVSIPPKSCTEVNTSMYINFKQTGNSAFDLLTKDENLDYDFIENLKILNEDKDFNDNKVVIESAGNLKPLIRTYQKDNN